MAMTDYFFSCNKIEKRTVSDGIGGFATIEYVGIEFRGLPVRKSSSEQLVGALRGNEQVQYTFHCPNNVPLKKDDVVRFSEPNSSGYKFIRLTSDEILNTEQSAQTNWKTYDAERYTPTSEVSE